MDCEYYVLLDKIDCTFFFHHSQINKDSDYK